MTDEYTWSAALQEAAEEIKRKARWCIEMERRGQPQDATACLLDVLNAMTHISKWPNNSTKDPQ